MATRSFLLNEELDEGKALLLSQASYPERISEARQAFGRWLEDRLLQRLNAFGPFANLKPVLLGSWSRHELTPRSDIDLLFAGPEDRVRDFIQQAFEDGVKLRARTPQDLDDWTVGVEPFDVLALGSAIALNPLDEAMVAAQRVHALQRRREIRREIHKEREARRQRQDSVASFLEPNLKYGAGGLRDIEQALALRSLFREVFAETDRYPFEVLVEVKEQLLYLRALLHLNGSGDVFSAQDQLELTRLLSMDSSQELMKQVQSQLERASFYADWVVASCAASARSRSAAREGMGSAQEALARLREEPGLLRQFESRRLLSRWNKAVTPIERGKLLHKALYDDQPDKFLVALNRTRWLDVLIPDFKKLKGLVQHDHYHRFTADAHLVQSLREVQRLKSSRRLFGVISRLTKELSAADWWTLKLTALFHDLAKGRKGDHSTEGAALVDRYFAQWSYPEGLREDVHWLVENHLLLSTAAFRQNPQAKTTWKRLFARGVEGRRLILLALFTAIDIRATNPEAWTPWKAQLLYNLVQNLQSKEAKSLGEYLRYLRRKKIRGFQEEWLLHLDPGLLQILPARVLVEDLVLAAQSKTDLPVKVLRTKDRRLWARFHRRNDQPGLFLGFVRQLFGLGLPIQMSSVHTLADVGVYDWFCLRSEKTPRQITSWLNAAGSGSAGAEVGATKVKFQSIDLMSQDDEEWVLSFRGKDQRGLLLAAAQALHEENLSLHWAKAHTWGGQVDDVFGVVPLTEDIEPLLARLRARLTSV